MIGLAAEVGELMNILHKAMRKYGYGEGVDFDTLPVDIQLKIEYELGDIFWNLVMACYEAKIKPSGSCRLNIAKLSNREKTGEVNDHE